MQYFHLYRLAPCRFHSSLSLLWTLDSSIADLWFSPKFVVPVSLQFTKAVESKQVAQQDAERARFVVLKADQVRNIAALENLPQNPKTNHNQLAAPGLHKHDSIKPFVVPESRGIYCKAFIATHVCNP